jgi:hypothetical protein
LDISLIYVDPKTRILSFKVGTFPITGVMKLVQIVVLSLLNISGKDVLRPEDGGGIPDLIGWGIDETNNTELLGEIVRRVHKTEVEVSNSQTGLDISPDEKLKSIKVLEVTRPSLDEVLVRLRLTNELGQSTDVVI